MATAAQPFGGIFDPCKDHGARGRLRQARHAMGRWGDVLSHGSAMAVCQAGEDRERWGRCSSCEHHQKGQFHAVPSSSMLTCSWLAWLNPMPPLGVLSISDLQAKADAEYNMQQAGNRCPNILGKWSLTLGRRMVKHGERRCDYNQTVRPEQRHWPASRTPWSVLLGADPTHPGFWWILVNFLAQYSWYSWYSGFFASDLFIFLVRYFTDLHSSWGMAFLLWAVRSCF